MSRRAWFSAFGRPFFFPSVLSLVGLPGSKQRGAWLGTVCPPRTTGIPGFGGSCSTGSRTSFRLLSFPDPLLLDPGIRRPPPTQKGSVISAEQVDRPVRPTRSNSGLRVGCPQAPPPDRSREGEPAHRCIWPLGEVGDGAFRFRGGLPSRGFQDDPGNTWKTRLEGSNPVVRPSPAHRGSRVCRESHTSHGGLGWGSPRRGGVVVREASPRDNYDSSMDAGSQAALDQHLRTPPCTVLCRP